MTRKKDKNLSIRTTTRRAEIIMSYAKQSEKTQTHDYFGLMSPV